MTEHTHDAAAGPYTFGDEMPVAGHWRRGSGRRGLQDVDPWTGQLLAELTPASEADVDEAFLAAQDAQPGWAAATPARRAEVMRAAAALLVQRRAEIIGWLVREVGGTVAKSTSEWAASRRAFQQAAELPYAIGGRVLASDIPGKEHRVVRRPVGVVAVLSPSNFPLYLTSRTLAPALAVGDAVVLKPSQRAPICGALLHARVLQDAGLPPGVLSVVVGRGREMGDVMVTHAVPRTICFTGSSAAGEAITRLAGVKKLNLELGGNSPLVVLRDADLDRAVEAAVWGSYYHHGQVRTSTNRIIVDAALHDAFVLRLVAAARALRVGDPSDPRTQIGPLISRAHLEGVQRLIAQATGAGGEVVLGGEPEGPAGLALPPHVLTGDARLATAREEVFGPVATVLRVQDEQEALTLANATDFGLSGAVFTRDVDRGLQFALRMETGMAHVNDATVHEEVHVPFGGEKQSGVGRCGATGLVEQLTTEHLVSLQRQACSRRL